MTVLDQRTPTVLDGECHDIPNPHRVHVIGAVITLGGSVAGLVTTALTQPQLIAYPVVTTFATAAAAGVAAVVHDRWDARHILKPA